MPSMTIVKTAVDEAMANMASTKNAYTIGLVLKARRVFATL
jgi:hypothetical protein